MWPRPAAPFEASGFVTIVSVTAGEDENSMLMVFSENPTAIPDAEGAIEFNTNGGDVFNDGTGTNHGTFWTVETDDNFASATSGTWTLLNGSAFVFASGRTLEPGQSGPVIFP
jgi:hypothetical protein